MGSEGRNLIVVYFYWQLLWYKIEVLLVVLKIEVFWDVTLCYMGK
jgi:hypothetical protein